MCFVLCAAVPGKCTRSDRIWWKMYWYSWWQHSTCHLLSSRPVRTMAVWQGKKSYYFHF